MAPLRSLPMPALTPARDLDLLDHIERRMPGTKGAGWRVAVEHGGRTLTRNFPDRGDGVEALRRAVAWRDQTISAINVQHGRLRSAGSDGPSTGVGIINTTTKGVTYRVAVAYLPAVDGGKPRRRVRSIDKYGYQEALRQCAQVRFDFMRDHFGDAYPYGSVEELVADVLAAQAVPTSPD